MYLKFGISLVTEFSALQYVCVCGILWDYCNGNHSKTHIMLFIWFDSRTVRLCISCLVVCLPGLAPCAPLWMMA